MGESETKVDDEFEVLCVERTDTNIYQAIGKEPGR
jgi:hypothetical protein